MSRVMGKRIVLREFRQEDISGMRSWVNDAGTTRYMGGIFRLPHTWEQTEAYLSNILQGEAGGVNLVIAEKETLKYLGQCNLFHVDQVSRSAELAIVVAPDSVNQGYGSEAISLLLSVAFLKMNLHRVWLQVFADNSHAIHVYEKCGFRREGLLREHIYQDGRYEDIVTMGILRRDYDMMNGDTIF